jgi:hypothetical protein
MVVSLLRERGLFSLNRIVFLDICVDVLLFLKADFESLKVKAVVYFGYMLSNKGL